MKPGREKRLRDQNLVPTWRPASAPGALLRLLLAGATGLTALYLLFADANQNFEEFGLGKSARVQYATMEGRKFHCTTWETLCKPLPNAQRRVLLMGNSQLHTIMRAQPEDELTVARMAPALAKSNIDLQVISAPHMTSQEMYLEFEAKHAHEHLDAVAIAVSVGSLEKDELHDGAAKVLDDKQVVAALSRTTIGRTLLDRLQRETSREGDGKATVEPGGEETPTTQQQVEAALVRWLEDHSSLWRLREQARGAMMVALNDLQYNLLVWRHSLMGRALPQTYQEIPASLYANNMEALLALLESARHANIKLLVYLQPRPVSGMAYDPQVFSKFKSVVETATLKAGGTFYDFTLTIPPEDWGELFNGRGGRAIDPNHFDGHGHRLFVEILMPAFRRLFEE